MPGISRVYNELSTLEQTRHTRILTDTLVMS